LGMALEVPSGYGLGNRVEEMKPLEDARYRLRLAIGFLEEARQDLSLGRWRSCVDNAQLSVENSLKSAIALWGPIPQTHNPAEVLAEMMDQGQIDETFREVVEKLLSCGEELGPDVHVRTDYGDELSGLTPWEIFHEEDARNAVAVAERAVGIVQDLLESLGREQGCSPHG